MYYSCQEELHSVHTHFSSEVHSTKEDHELAGTAVDGHGQELSGKAEDLGKIVEQTESSVHDALVRWCD